VPERSVKSSLRRSRSPLGILLLVGLVLASPAWAQTPAPDPPPSGLAPDPPPQAAAPPPAPAPTPPPPAAPTPAITDVVETPRPAAREPAQPARPEQKRKPKPEPKPAAKQPPAVDSQPRDSTMPRPTLDAPGRVLERSRIVLAGLALVVVALGGAVVLGTGRRALVEARA
jgi:outer membrane biosynthesis protein TonB